VGKEQEANMTALPLIAVDVCEALLDLATMEPTFQHTFGDKSAMGRGLPFVIRYSAAMNVAGCYVPFTISVRR
jgi:2-haloacid dehalogenase